MFQQEHVLQHCCVTKEEVHDVLVKINIGRKAAASSRRREYLGTS